eukprot:GHVS01002991.1.p1 GENE.GHVS01002991.1~~GHVS01002991.1.p1  ORF type:complete len:114 (+),score=26.72 GHVS01002991.1:133-474(+)
MVICRCMCAVGCSLQICVLLVVVLQICQQPLGVAAMMNGQYDDDNNNNSGSDITPNSVTADPFSPQLINGVVASLPLPHKEPNMEQFANAQPQAVGTGIDMTDVAKLKAPGHD